MRIFIFGFLLSTTAVAIPDIIKTVDSSVLSSLDVQYNCVFENQWTNDRHSKDYPSDHAVHWTRQVLASHSSTYNMWKEGSLASNAVKIMAEAGGTANIVREIEKLDENSSYEIGYDKYIMGTPDQTMRFNNPLRMTFNNRYVSVISKMAPSPDWFSGFNDFNAVNEDKKTWYKEFTIETYPYDAGTEDGNTYATDPPQPITQFTVNNVPNNGIYLNTDGNDILPVAKYTCTLNTYSSSNADIEMIDSYVPSSQDIQYNCAFENQWNKDRHPWEFPQNPLIVHWTKQVLASHDSSYTMWKEGTVASSGIEKLAESGGIGDIIQELQDRGNSYDIGYDKYLYVQDPKVTYEPLRMTSSKRYISAISKLAPSPDWFSGFHDFNAVNKDSDTWYQEFIIPIYPFDAGTENGETYNTVNSRTVPVQPITQFSIDHLPNDEIFLNREGDGILPVATYTCTLSTLNGGMEPTQSSILFPSLTRSPTEAQQSDMVSAAELTNDAGLIAGITIGAIAAIFIVGALFVSLICMLLHRTSRDEVSKETVEETFTTTSSSEAA